MSKYVVTFRSGRSLFVVTLLTIFLTLQSCMTTRIVSKYDSDTMVNNPANRKTAWTFAWGLVQTKDINPKCESGAMTSVTVKTNIGFILVSAATLGIAVPLKVEWTCNPTSIPTEQLGE